MYVCNTCVVFEELVSADERHEHCGQGHAPAPSGEWSAVMRVSRSAVPQLVCAPLKLDVRVASGLSPQPGTLVNTAKCTTQPEVNQMFK